MSIRSVVIASLILLSAIRGSADDLDRRIQAEMARQQVPGLTFAVVQHGKIARLGAYGFGDLEWHARATNATEFEIASISKMFTGAAARILMEEGKLDPEDPVSKYLGDVPESWKEMKVRHLLTMSTGLDEDWASDLIPYDADVLTPASAADMLKAFQTMKPVAPLGTEFHYSSPGYAMIGMIVEKITGQPLSTFITERIFHPAGMTHSSFIDNWAIIPERAQGYRKDKNGQLLKGWYLGQYLHSRPDTGILTTARDMAAWILALENRKIVKDPGKLWEGSIADSGRYLDYEYGWLAGTLLGHRSLSHGGGYRTGFTTFLVRYPDDDLSIIVLTNCNFSSPSRFAFLVTEKYMKGITDPASPAPGPDADPAETAVMLAAIRGLGEGKVDPAVMYPDAVDPVGVHDTSEFLKSVQSIDFAGRGRVPARGLRMHGHTLVDFETFRLKTKDDTYYVTLYRDDHGKIAYFEATS